MTSPHPILIVDDNDALRASLAEQLAFEGEFAATGAASSMWLMTTTTFSGLSHMIQGAISSCNLSGAIGMAETAGDAARNGLESFIGRWFYDNGMQLMFAWPGIVMVTVFVTAPYVARILIPVMQTQGQDEETAAMCLGASGWQIFRRISLPKIKWALLYGVVVTNARAVGEFGAVSVVSGHIRGETNTLPLHVEILYNEYQFSAAFAVASILAFLALITLGIKTWVEYQAAKQGVH